MFGTVILDAYTDDERTELSNAIDDLCNPSDSYGWASAGIYSFWNYYTHEILYIGLASDLYERFRQHNGLSQMDIKGCKYSQINQYFKSYDKLGYTIFVQSPLSQPLVHRNKELFEKMASEHNSDIKDYTNSQGIKDIKRVEGILIEAYRKSYGDFPKWNKVGGSIQGQNKVKKNNINIVKSFCSPQDININPIMSRSSIRELSSNPTYERYESFLHSVRMLVLLFGMDYPEALQFINNTDPYNCYEEIKNSGYLTKSLSI